MGELGRATFSESVRWLLESRNRRHYRVLEALCSRPQTARDLVAELGVDHAEQVYRALEYLQDRGLVEGTYDPKQAGRGQVFEASVLGQRAVQLVVEIEGVLRAEKNRGPSSGSFWISVSTSTSGSRLRIRSGTIRDTLTTHTSSGENIFAGRSATNQH